MNRRLIIPAAVIGLASIAACGPPANVHALLQRGACDAAAVAPAGNRCIHYVNHLAAWGYPPETEWINAYWPEFTFDLSHNGAEELP